MRHGCGERRSTRSGQFPFFLSFSLLFSFCSSSRKDSNVDSFRYSRLSLLSVSKGKGAKAEMNIPY